MRDWVEKDESVMEHRVWPLALRERLGESGSAALADVLAARENAMLIAATERFDRHLDDRFDSLGRQIRAEMHDLRVDMRQLVADVRGDAKVGLANTRADLTKWMLLFWIGQAAFIIGLVTAFR